MKKTIAGVLIAGAALFGAACSNNQEDAAQHERDLDNQTKTSLQAQLDEKMGQYHLVVTDVKLVKSEGNKYEGFAVVHGPKGIDHNVTVHATEGASGTLYETDRGDFLWAISEQSGWGA